MAQPKPVDVFICYPAAERDRAIALHRALGEQSTRPFLAEVDLLPGDLIDRAVPAALEASRIVVVLVSEEGMDWWQSEQTARAIDRILKRDDAEAPRVIPLVMGSHPPDDMPYGLTRLVALYWTTPGQVAAAIAALLDPERPVTHSPRRVVITESADHVLVGGVFVQYATIEEDERAGSITLTTSPLSSDQESALRTTLGAWQDGTVAFANRVVRVSPLSTRFKHQSGDTLAELVLRRQNTHGSTSYAEVAWGGPGQSRTADEIAELRARRILLIDDQRHPNGLERLVRGMFSIGVDRSPLPDLLTRPLGEGIDRWQRIRLALLDLLVRSNCVERVAHLTLTVDADRLTHIAFRGVRARAYSNVEPTVIEIEGAPSLT